jgi:small subunit ribosomal protein S4
MKLAVTPFAARQLVSHGHISVNGRRVTVSSYMVKLGDKIEVRSKSKDLAVIKEATESAERDVPDYIEIDHSKYVGEIKRIPGLKDVPYPVTMEPNLVIEFYSR